jgi:hypothetical protein
MERSTHNYAATFIVAPKLGREHISQVAQVSRQSCE